MSVKREEIGVRIKMFQVRRTHRDAVLKRLFENITRRRNDFAAAVTSAYLVREWKNKSDCVTVSVFFCVRRKTSRNLVSRNFQKATPPGGKLNDSIRRASSSYLFARRNRWFQPQSVCGAIAADPKDRIDVIAISSPRNPIHAGFREEYSYRTFAFVQSRDHDRYSNRTIVRAKRSCCTVWALWHDGRRFGLRVDRSVECFVVVRTCSKHWPKKTDSGGLLPKSKYPPFGILNFLFFLLKITRISPNVLICSLDRRRATTFMIIPNRVVTLSVTTAVPLLLFRPRL